MARSGNRSLKLKQLVDSMKKRSPMPIEDLGKRLKNIREALGITQKQLAKKLMIKQPLIARFEKNIMTSSLETVSKIANGLECELMGTIISREPLDKLIRKRAEITAKKILNRTFSNMALEKQAPGSEAYEFQLKKKIEELTADPGPILWEE
jgi:transcriptional regulator with XRE-family HTH domain